jgi:hypothetical protein
VNINAPAITLNSDKATTLTGGGGKAKFALDGDAALTAGNVVLKSSGAKLQLDANAQLKGAKVKLGSGSGGSVSGSKSSSSSKTQKQEWVIQLYEPAARAGDPPKPLANANVTARGHGPDPFSGSTDGAGQVRIPVVHPECLIEITAGKYQFNVHANGMLDDPEHKTRTARQRLQNLGYGPGDADAWTQEQTLDEIDRFQQLNGLQGERHSGLSATTVSAIKAKMP